MTRKYFGTDGVRGRVGESPITPDWVLRLGHAAGACWSRRATIDRSPGRAHRQGHPPLRLHARSGARVGAVRGGRRRVPVGPAADARGRAPDARAAAAGRHRDQRLAQSVRGQRDQVLLGGAAPSCPMRLELAIEAALEQPITLRRRRATSAAPSAWPTRPGRYIEFCKGTFPERPRPARACASSSTARTAPAITSRRRYSASWAPT